MWRQDRCSSAASDQVYPRPRCGRLPKASTGQHKVPPRPKRDLLIFACYAILGLMEVMCHIGHILCGPVHRFHVGRAQYDLVPPGCEQAGGSFPDTQHLRVTFFPVWESIAGKPRAPQKQQWNRRKTCAAISLLRATLAPSALPFPC